MIRTKIICTIGPACSDDVMRGLLQGGMDCARMNFSHGSHKEHLERLQRFRKIRDELGLSTAVLLDTKGPEIRTGKFENPVSLSEGQSFLISYEDIDGSNEKMSVSYKDLHKDIEAGQRILIDDGLVGMRVSSVESNGDINCIVENGGEISSHKSVNVPGANINLPSMTEIDESDILFAIEHDYDFIAISFVRKASDVQAVRKLLEKSGGNHIQIISKIENQQGVDNIDAIVRVSDGIMVARGDLGVEIPVEQVPIVQKHIIKKCMQSDKLVIIATQMLDSMIRNPRPTRAEASDVANAIFDGATCTMLSGETANGKYPVESLKTMVDIARSAESSINYWGRIHSKDMLKNSSVTDAISLATCTTAMQLNAKCIATVSNTGHTARAISRFHPGCNIVCATPSKHVERQLHLSWGVSPIFVDMVASTDALFDVAISAAEKTGLVKSGDLLVITAGVPVGISGTTNTIKVQMVGNTLLRGRSIRNVNASITSEVHIVTDPESVDMEECSGHIVVAHAATQQLLPLLRKASAVVIEQEDSDGYAANAALMLDIPVLDRVGGAIDILKNSTVVTLETNEDGIGFIKHR